MQQGARCDAQSTRSLKLLQNPSRHPRWCRMQGHLPFHRDRRACVSAGCRMNSGLLPPVALLTVSLPLVGSQPKHGYRFASENATPTPA